MFTSIKLHLLDGYEISQCLLGYVNVYKQNLKIFIVKIIRYLISYIVYFLFLIRFFSVKHNFVRQQGCPQKCQPEEEGAYKYIPFLHELIF